MNASDAVGRLRYAMRSPGARMALVLNLVVVAALLIVVFFYWWPRATERQLLNESVAQARRALTRAMQANDLIAAYRTASRATQTVETKLQLSIKQAQLVQSLARLVARHGVRIVSESYEEGKRQGDYMPLFLQVTLEGRYAGVRGFLSDVHALPLWVEVQDVRLERMRESAGSLKAQLRLRAVRRAEIAAVASGS